MKKTFLCSQESPLHQQIAEEEKLMISEIYIKGYLGGDDLMLLSDLSKNGRLRLLDMYDVRELYTNDLEEDGTRDCFPFFDNDRIEEVRLQQISSIDYPMFCNCRNLKSIEFPDTINGLCDCFMSDCPNIEEIYVPSNLRIDYDGRYDDDYCFVGSGKRFVSDFNRWPEEDEEIPGSFFTNDGVLYEDGVCGISLHRYPAGDERKGFSIPEGVTNIDENAFNGNPFLRRLIIPKSVNNIENNPILGCMNLETIIFKNEKFEMFTCKAWTYAININPWGLCLLPGLKDIYLYADNPENIDFGLFDGLENIGEVTLHVPCFCAEKYRNHEVEYGSALSSSKKYIEAWRRFKRIEEFDPVDFIDDLS